MDEKIICPVCERESSIDACFCERCGWEFRYFLQPLSGDFLMYENKRLEIARKVWSKNNVRKQDFSYGFLVSYHGEECVSNMIRYDEPVVVSHEWPKGKFVTQDDGQSQVSIHIYRNKSNEKIVPLADCEKVMNAIIQLEERVPKGTPIQICWERDDLYNIYVKVTCLTKETIIRI